MEPINERLRDLRDHLNLTQSAFSQLTGVSTVFISHLENGKSAPGKNTLKAIIKSTGVSRDWLLNGSGEMEINSVPPIVAESKGSSWKDEAYQNLKDQKEHLEKEVQFLREVVRGFTGKIQSANFKEAFVPAGILESPIIQMVTQNIDESVSVSENGALTA